MRINKGDYVLVQTPAYGYSTDTSDFGPFIFRVDGFDCGIQLTRHISKTSIAGITVSFETPMIKIHEKDVEILIKPSMDK